MRQILRKTKRKEQLSSEELTQLQDYIHTLYLESRDSFRLFHDQYGTLLGENYQMVLPPLNDDVFELVNYLLAPSPGGSPSRDRSGLLRSLLARYGTLQTPGADVSISRFYRQVCDYLQSKNIDGNNLPRPRQHDPVFIYEDANPHKEAGLSVHFERMARFTFISRLQSIRYLSGNKASRERIDYWQPDTLRGIFTNKDKSIYYYIYLTENDRIKALNACELLNFSLYGVSQAGEDG